MGQLKLYVLRGIVASQLFHNQLSTVYTVLVAYLDMPIPLI